jgi:carboxyl-terminal processing protease
MRRSTIGHAAVLSDPADEFVLDALLELCLWPAFGHCLSRSATITTVVASALAHRRLVNLLAVTGLLASGCTGSHHSPPSTSPSASATMAPTARRYLDEALDVMQHHALNRATLDWRAIRQQATSDAAGAVTASDTYAAIDTALGRLKDDAHSSFGSAPSSKSTTSPIMTPSQLPSGRLLPGPIGYVELPGNSAAFADRYQAAGSAVMHRLQKGQPFGWIVDLPSNNGGDVWPMLGGLQPLLGSGPIGAFVPPTGPPSSVKVTPTELTVDGKVQIHISAANPQDASADPVVVLMGPTTASSAEFVAITFRGRPCAISIGAPTKGVPTANQSYRLSDGATLILTVALESDRTGHVYPDAPIRPDTEIGHAHSFATWSQSDPAIRAASQWLTLHRNFRP